MNVGTDELSREAARRLAREELSRKDYADAQPPLLLRLVTRALRALGRAFDAAGGALPGGRVGLVLLLVLLVGAAAVLLARLRPARGARREALFAGTATVTADEHRRRAEQLAAAGDLAGALRERLRAVVRELETRGVLDARPGRTADELATEAAAALPALAGDLRRATTAFDEVWYGGRPADDTSYAVVVELDRRVQLGPLAMT